MVLINITCVFVLHTRFIQKVFLICFNLYLYQKRTLNLDIFANFSMLLKVMRIFSMYLFWRLVKARDFKIKYTQEPGLNMRKKLFIEFQKIFWSEAITKAEKNLLKALYICICERLFSIKEKSCIELRFFEKGHESEDLKEYIPAFIVRRMFFQWGFFSELSERCFNFKKKIHPQE